MFGFVTCQMVGFCHISRKDQEDWDDGEREYDEDGNRLYFPYTPKEVKEEEQDADNPPQKRTNEEHDDDDAPGESAQWPQEDWPLFAAQKEDENNKIGCRNIEGHLRKGDLPHQLELFFPSDRMRHCTKLRFFSDTYFNAPLPCILPESIIKEQSLLPNSAIAAGKYLIQRVAEGFLLVVDIA